MRQCSRGIASGHRRCFRAGLEPAHEQLRTSRSRSEPVGASDNWTQLRTKLETVPDVLTFEWPVVFAPARDRPILFTASAWAEVLLTLDRRDFTDLLGTSFYGLAILKSPVISCRGSAPPADWPGGPDREFVASLATRIIELRPGASGGAATVVDFRGSYQDYLAGAGAAQRAA
jgi:hypothetical protein